jgi:hypothetical protein
MNRFPQYKQFIGIYFSEESWAVTPTIWLTVGAKSVLHTFWPNEGDVNELARNLVPPNKKWSTWKICRVAETSGNKHLCHI